ILDLVPDSHLRLDQHPSARWAAEPDLAGARTYGGATRLALDRYRGLYRHRLLLPSVHGAADLRHARKDGRDADRGRHRSRLPALEGVLAGHPAAVAPRRGCRSAALLHSDRRRVRNPRSARRLPDADDRPDPMD